jgi:hypothetical protein
MNEIYDLLEWQKVWDWASKTTLAPFLLSQTPLREQIEQEGITDALGMTTWHSQFGGAMNTYAHPFRCYLNEVDPPRGGYELWGIDNQGADREIWDDDEPWVEPRSSTYHYAIPTWVQEAIIRVNLLRTTWIMQAQFLTILQMCNPAEHDFHPLVDLELDGNDQALPIEALPRIYAALADLIAGIEQAGEDTADTDRWWYVTVRKPDVAEAKRRIAALGYQVGEGD